MSKDITRLTITLRPEQVEVVQAVSKESDIGGLESASAAIRYIISDWWAKFGKKNGKCEATE